METSGCTGYEIFNNYLFLSQGGMSLPYEHKFIKGKIVPYGKVQYEKIEENFDINAIGNN